MIKLSTKTRYATRFMLELALSETSQPILLKDIAGRQNISAGYLEQIVPALKSANLILSNRGYRGGYSLAKKADAITLRDIVEAVEGPVALIECLNSAGKGNSISCSRQGLCAAEKMWSEINEDLINSLGSKTLESLAEKQRNIKRAAALNYSI